MTTLTIQTRCRVVLVDFFDDPDGFLWHMRLLMVHGGGSSWIAASPDHDLELLDLARHRVIPLRPGEPFPERTNDQVYAFDEFEEGEEDALVVRAKDYAAAVGFVAGGAEVKAGIWRVSDTAHPLFGEEVPSAAIASEENVVVRGGVGLALVDDGWVTIERVDDSEFDGWRAKKGYGPGHDRRIIGEVRDSRGRRYIREEDAIGHWSGRSVPDSPLQGPTVTLVFFEALRTAGLTVIGHHAEWRTRSGIAEKAAVAREHFYLSEALRLEVTVDQIDPTQLVSTEFRVRRLLQIEAAVERNPRQPDFEGLELMLSSAVTPTGAVVTEKFTEWLTARQRDAAQVMKQGRILREERAAEVKRRGGKDPAAQGG